MEDFFKHKIVYGQFQDGAEYSFAEEGIFLSSNEYMIITQNYSAQCLLAFLNSKLIEWLLNNITGNLGGNAKIGQKSNFLKLPIAILSTKEQKIFENIVNEILTNKTKNRETGVLEEKINKMIYSIYAINDDEIKEIENS